MKEYQPHQAVLERECLKLLAPDLNKIKTKNYWMVDCTCGAGGHS